MAPQPVRLSLQPALLGPGPASAHHAPAAARGARARAGRADPRGRAGHRLLRAAGRRMARARRERSRSSTSSRRCSTTRSRRAREAGLGNMVPTQGDARELPYDDDAVDGAYLVTVLGEIPDQEAALRELARVVRPGGRVVVGELIGDPHWVIAGRAPAPGRARPGCASSAGSARRWGTSPCSGRPSGETAQIAQELRGLPASPLFRRRRSSPNDSRPTRTARFAGGRQAARSGAKRAFRAVLRRPGYERPR